MMDATCSFFYLFLHVWSKKSVMDARGREWNLIYRVELALADIFMWKWLSASNREKIYKAIES
jgi:hypothetical protein